MESPTWVQGLLFVGSLLLLIVPVWFGLRITCRPLFSDSETGAEHGTWLADTRGSLSFNDDAEPFTITFCAGFQLESRCPSGTSPEDDALRSGRTG